MSFAFSFICEWTSIGPFFIIEDGHFRIPKRINYYTYLIINSLRIDKYQQLAVKNDKISKTSFKNKKHHMKLTMQKNQGRPNNRLILAQKTTETKL
jgi:hypothetical protein